MVSDYTTPTCLIILDGYGLAEAGPGNAVDQATTPVLDDLFAQYPHIQLEASGKSVGLPEGQMGNSEVGHLNIGAGRIVYQELTRINDACEQDLLGEREAITQAYLEAKEPGRVLHLMGLVSDGGVHSNNQHLYALMQRAVELKVPQVFVHCFMDGRDVLPSSGLTYIEELEQELSQLNGGDTSISIASISGRYYAMDRDRRWERVERAYNALVAAEPSKDLTPTEVMRQSYEQGITDEFVEPIALQKRGIRSKDSVLFFNFRPDRAREITRSFVDKSFSEFERLREVNTFFVCLTEYDPTIDAPVAFEKEFPQEVLADVLAGAGLKQYHIAETEKYAHVTFFLNGGIEESKTQEVRQLIPSPQVATYDLKPEMSAPEVADTLARAIKADEADVYIVNFANCDMVGHTGILKAAVEAVEAVDTAVGVVLRALREKDGTALLTADHGNADKMLDEKGEPFTAHTTAQVPFVLIDYSKRGLHLVNEEGTLSSVAPTLLEIIGLPIPSEMTSKSLLAKEPEARV